MWQWLPQCVLPLWGRHLHAMPSKTFMVLSGLAACVLHPAMCHSWLDLHVANANFAFAASMLLCAWQVSLSLGTLHPGSSRPKSQCCPSQAVCAARCTQTLLCWGCQGIVLSCEPMYLQWHCTCKLQQMR